MVSERNIKELANVGAAERLASTAVGGLLLTWGLQKRSPAAIAGALVGADLIYRGVSGHSKLYSALGVNTATATKSGAHVAAEAPEIRRSITVAAPPERLYSMWREPATLARIMAHFAEITASGDNVTRWRVRGPLRQVFESDSRLVEDEANHRLSWQTLPGGTMVSRGSVNFRPGPDETGTVVTLNLQFEPPLGAAGAGLVKAFHKIPRAIVGQALRRLKSLAETGEIPTLEHNPSGRGASDMF